MAVTTRYETIIGIEVHAQLRTASKMFCDCPTSAPEGMPDEPNTRVCPVCLALPGTLPVINRRAVELVILTGLALGCHVETEAVRFERKNYFYPDLPKGYQISQYALPLASRGRLAVPVAAEDAEVVVGITRAHLDRIAEVDGPVHAFLHVDADGALEQDAAADREVLDQVADLDEGLAHDETSSRGRRP